MKAVFCSLLVLVLAIGSSRAAPAPPTPAVRAKAKALYDSASTHYNLSEYEDALKDFKEAYRLVKDPVLLFNIAQCHRQLRQFVEAARLYRAYRREFPNAPNRQEAERLIAQMDESVAEERAHQPPTGTLEYGPQPSPQPVVVAPVVEAPPTSTNALTAAPPPKEKPVYKKGWFWGVVVGAAVVVAVGVGVGVAYGDKGDSTRGLPDVKF